MPFLEVALTSQISATMTVVAFSKFSHCAGGSSKRRIQFSWPNEFWYSKSGVFLGQWACQSMSWVYWRRDAQKLHIWKESKTHLNKRCIPAVLSCLFDKVAANHKITFKMTDSAILHNWLIQFYDWLNGALLDTKVLMMLAVRCLCQNTLFSYCN